MSTKIILAAFIISIFVMAMPDDSSAQRMRGGNRGSINRSGNTGRNYSGNKKLTVEILTNLILTEPIRIRVIQT
ncbi:MAG: hypothetical protein IPL53_05350 [Ignavibacteria bacterium]|nr:hypothetical protein [Ignavibacteria bacterium]